MRAFTLLEVLVVIGIIALLIAILVPSLRQARDQAREVQCATNLHQFGRGFHAYSAGNKGFLCSGSFDPGEDAAPDATPETNNGRDGPVDKVGWVADLVNSKTAYPGETLCPTNDAKFNQKLGDQGSSAGPYTAAQADDYIARGYNTNYTQSWYMARSEVTQLTELNWKRIWGKRGPLSVPFMSRVAPDRVPILGDGSIESEDTYRGQKTVRTMTDGPFEGPYSVQNYEDFGPAHGHGGLGSTTGLAASEGYRANILFADGHVEPFIDKVRNGRFAVIQSPTSTLGEQEDLDPGRVFDGVISMGGRSKDNWTKKR